MELVTALIVLFEMNALNCITYVSNLIPTERLTGRRLFQHSITLLSTNWFGLLEA